jgi:hypothetical protein
LADGSLSTGNSRTEKTAAQRARKRQGATRPEARRHGPFENSRSFIERTVISPFG